MLKVKIDSDQIESKRKKIRELVDATYFLDHDEEKKDNIKTLHIYYAMTEKDYKENKSLTFKVLLSDPKKNEKLEAFVYNLTMLMKRGYMHVDTDVAYLPMTFGKERSIYIKQKYNLKPEEEKVILYPLYRKEIINTCKYIRTQPTLLLDGMKHIENPKSVLSEFKIVKHYIDIPEYPIQNVNRKQSDIDPIKLQMEIEAEARAELKEIAPGENFEDQIERMSIETRKCIDKGQPRELIMSFIFTECIKKLF